MSEEGQKKIIRVGSRKSEVSKEKLKEIKKVTSYQIFNYWIDCN